MDFRQSNNIVISKNWMLKYDLDYSINKGLTGVVGKNAAVLNASLEKQLFKNQHGIIRLQGFDLFNQNTKVTHTVNSNSITDSQSSRLNRYPCLVLYIEFKNLQANKHNPNSLQIL